LICYRCGAEFKCTRKRFLSCKERSICFCQDCALETIRSYYNSYPYFARTGYKITLKFLKNCYGKDVRIDELKKIFLVHIL